jgi:hypothetical protein
MATRYTSDHSWSRYWSTGPEQIQDALQAPHYHPSEVRTLADMTEDEINELEKTTGCKVIRPVPDEAESTP